MIAILDNGQNGCVQKHAVVYLFHQGNLYDSEILFHGSSDILDTYAEKYKLYSGFYCTTYCLSSSSTSNSSPSTSLLSKATSSYSSSSKWVAPVVISAGSTS